MLSSIRGVKAASRPPPSGKRLVGMGCTASLRHSFASVMIGDAAYCLGVEMWRVEQLEVLSWYQKAPRQFCAYRHDDQAYQGN